MNYRAALGAQRLSQLGQISGQEALQGQQVAARNIQRKLAYDSDVSLNQLRSDQANYGYNLNKIQSTIAATDATVQSMGRVLENYRRGLMDDQAIYAMARQFGINPTGLSIDQLVRAMTEKYQQLLG